jgi:hypothetical protein
VSEHPVVVDPLAPVVASLLGCLTERLAVYDVPVCRSFWHPGATAPWDACGTVDGGAEGQAWVAVQRVYPTDRFPAQVAEAHRCVPSGYGAEVVVGILRCAATVDDSGRAPTGDRVTVDAVKVSRDRQIILETIVCCLFGDDPDPGGFRLGAWEPLGPNGGCVGGQWRLDVALPACRCPDLPPLTGFGIDPFGTSPFGGE